jgi:hypothetical protein
MKKIINKSLTALLICFLPWVSALASSHREAPLIANDPTADNTDVYAFKSPNDPNKMIIIANYIPFEHPAGGPNWYTFGENIRYEIHIKNKTTTAGDDVTYRFTFTHKNEDSTTFFNIRLGKQNIKATYICEVSQNGGAFVLIANGTVPPPNIGPRSIEGAAGLGMPYSALVNSNIVTALNGERVFCGPADDPFFVDLGGAFDVGGFRNPGRDGLAKMNVHSICMEIPVENLHRNHQPIAQALNILDPSYVIGVWASASRPQIQTLNGDGTKSATGAWVQVSRLGMPLTNEVIIPVGTKDLWESQTPYNNQDVPFIKYFVNPELALYMDTTQFANAVPGLSALRIQAKSLGTYDFRNGKQGLYPLKGMAALGGTALSDTLYGTILLPDNHSPRAVDILPIFYTGVPNLAPYQLATGKNGNPLAVGKPFVNNFLPTLGDMLRVNMAVPATSRTDVNFSSEGLLAAAVLGLTNPAYNANSTLQLIPNMDGFPNGRRLEDDITTIELQAVSGVVLAAIGLWYDDYTGTGSPVTPMLGNVLNFNAGVTHNDTTLKTAFPFVQEPWRGYTGSAYVGPTYTGNLNIGAPEAIMTAYPNPFVNTVNFRYKLASASTVRITVFDVTGRVVRVINEGQHSSGDYTTRYDGAGLVPGTYLARLSIDDRDFNTVKLTKVN